LKEKKPGAANIFNPLGLRPSKGARIGLHSWTGRTKEFKGIAPGEIWEVKLSWFEWRSSWKIILFLKRFIVIRPGECLI